MDGAGAGAPPPKRPRGRPPSGNPPAKRAYSLDRAKREGTRVYLLNYFPSWVQQKKEFETSFGDGEAGKRSSHAEFANHLLKHHSDRLCRLCKRADDEETAELEVFHFDTGDQMLMDKSLHPHSEEATPSDEIDDAKCIVSLREITKLLQNVYGPKCSKCSKNLFTAPIP
ncbi:hypothetical protein BSL78_02293 [Apostichopus japonicus]|uniref:Uncharacterized protein n=1 Tax=Stichopus japonicus TaxID=307972 RepID=A0A2G8LKT4_STIJA|nr:hypothetical protein BSL78_02293 [Apostichopus japonicus]